MPNSITGNVKAEFTEFSSSSLVVSLSVLTFEDFRGVMVLVECERFGIAIMTVTCMTCAGSAAPRFSSSGTLLHRSGLLSMVVRMSAGGVSVLISG